MSINLNEAQRKAAEQLTGGVLVTAGAGSGKTRMLTERFANAVVAGRLAEWSTIDPGEVVAITYTEKAAGEIGERVRAEIGRSAGGAVGGRDDLWVSTIHGFCGRILRQNPFEAGVDALLGGRRTGVRPAPRARIPSGAHQARRRGRGGSADLLRPTAKRGCIGLSSRSCVSSASRGSVSIRSR